MSKIAPLQKCLLMRNGSEIWLPREKVDTLESACINGSVPRWVKLTDADGRTINTADISEFLTPEQADERHRLKLGEWKCQYNRWHGKRDRCECKRQIAQAKYEAEQKRMMDEASKPFTPEQIARNKAKLAEMKQALMGKINFNPEEKPGPNLKQIEEITKAQVQEARAAKEPPCQVPPADPPEPITDPEDDDRKAWLGPQSQIDKDAAEFDKRYLGETDEIDVSKIPF